MRCRNPGATAALAAFGDSHGQEGARTEQQSRDSLVDPAARAIPEMARCRLREAGASGPARQQQDAGAHGRRPVGSHNSLLSCSESIGWRLNPTERSRRARGGLPGTAPGLRPVFQPQWPEIAMVSGTGPCARPHGPVCHSRLSVGVVDAWQRCGQVAEWLKAPHSKCGIGATLSGVRIPPCPPFRSAIRVVARAPDFSAFQGLGRLPIGVRQCLTTLTYTEKVHLNVHLPGASMARVPAASLAARHRRSPHPERAPEGFICIAGTATGSSNADGPKHWIRPGRRPL